MGNGSHTLYRFFDAEGVLLYIGVTNNPPRRFAQHRAEKWWWESVDSIKLQSLPSREELFIAERLAIWDEKPKYNIAMNNSPDRVVTRKVRGKKPDRICFSCRGPRVSDRYMFCDKCSSDSQAYRDAVQEYHELSSEAGENDIPAILIQTEIARRMGLYWRYREQIEDAERDRIHRKVGATV